MVWREELSKWWDAELNEHLMAGLHQARLKIDDDLKKLSPPRLFRVRMVHQRNSVGFENEDSARVSEALQCYLSWRWRGSDD